jgi:serine/threonine protein kinase/Flp pilus assembly protein TadD
MIGKTILHYKILEKLGEGGMGVVYLAEDTKLKREVAIKFLPQYITADQEQKKRFELEAQAAASLNHPNITTIYAIEESDSEVFIVMEYIDGIELKDKIKSEPISIEEAVKIVIQIAEGLGAAHRKGIVHRDIKSQNIMIKGDGKVKIMDFGLAILKGASRLTQAGSTLGTTAYMSPEQTRGAELDHRTDIFSFGVVLYELLTAHLPFNGEHQAAIVYSVVYENPQPLAHFNDKVTPELERIVNKALSKDKDERYRHVDDMLADLRRERKNLEYTQAGYIKSSTSGQVGYEKIPEIKIWQRNKIVKIIIPAIVVLIIISVFIFLNPFKSSVNEEQSAGTLKNSLAVMYFENIPDPEDKDHNSEMLTNLLITSLSQVKGLEVISRERLLNIQKDLGQDNKTISASFANQVAKQAGVNAMLIGSILQEKPNLAVTTRLIDVRSGNIISSQQVTIYKVAKIFSLVDTLALLIRKNLPVSLGESGKIKSIADVTTKSPEAYRAYTAGLELLEKRYVKEAVAAFSRAIELDKNFAMAYYYLSKVQSFTGVTDASQKSLKKAIELADRTTERERLQILTYNYAQENNFPKAVEGYNQLIEKFPLDINSYVQLGANLYAQALLEPEKGLEILRQGLIIEPSSKTLQNLLGYIYAWLNKRKEAIHTANAYINMAPAEPNPYDTKGDLYAWFRDYDSSRAAYRKAISLRSDFISNARLGSYSILDNDYDNARKYFNACSFELPLVEVHRGQIKNAEEKLSNLPGSQITGSNKLRTLINYSYEAGQYPEMLKLANQLSTELKKDPTDKIYGRDYLTWAMVKNGRISEAHSVFSDLENDVNGISAFLQMIGDYTYALISLEEGKNESALKRFRKVIQTLPPNHEPYIFYSIALLRTGQISEAITELQKLKYWPNHGDLYIVRGLPGSNLDWPIPAVKAYYWLGIAYEKQGNKEKAIAEFKKFIEIWKDADFTSPELKDAKVQIQKLEGMAAK